MAKLLDRTRSELCGVSILGVFFIILYNKTSLKYISKKMVFNGLKKISIVVIIAKVLNFCI